MSAAKRLEAYATPAEQVELLSAHLSDPNAWVLRWNPANPEAATLLSREGLSSEQIEQDAQYHFGDYTIHAPEYRITRDGRAIPDLITSGAVQFRAGAIDEEYLYESFLAMMPVDEYERVGIPGEQVANLFSVLSRWITSRRSKTSRLMMRKSHENLVPVPSVVVTSAAAELASNGVKLKQMPISRVEFVLKHTNPSR